MEVWLQRRTRLIRSDIYQRDDHGRVSKYMNLEKIFEDYIAHEGRENIDDIMDRLTKESIDDIDWDHIREEFVERFKEYP